MIKINNESELIEKLNEDVKTCEKESIVLQAGHFPLMYLSNRAIEAIDYWGQFSKYSLELGCMVGQYGKEIGKQVQFVFFVDDHSYEEMSSLGITSVKSRRARLYKEKSGIGAKLHPEYQKIMNLFGFNENDVVRHDHKKFGREDCLYFSEKVLRASSREIENSCAKEYTEFIEDPNYFNKSRSYLISFGPNRCQGHICNVALDLEIKNLSASHVFMETMDPLATKKQLYERGRGVTYRKD